MHFLVGVDAQITNKEELVEFYWVHCMVVELVAKLLKKDAEMNGHRCRAQNQCCGNRCCSRWVCGSFPQRLFAKKNMLCSRDGVEVPVIRDMMPGVSFSQTDL